MSTRSYLSIGDVLTLLRHEFPDITISKIRFLESQGLVNPERTPSGYRKFYEHDVERLRWVLRQQREHFLPLKVIKDRLEEDANSAAPGSERSARQTPSAKAATEPVPVPEPALVGQRASVVGMSTIGATGPTPETASVNSASRAASFDGPAALDSAAQATSHSDGSTDHSSHGLVGRANDRSLSASGQRTAPPAQTARSSNNGHSNGIGATATPGSPATPPTPATRNSPGDGSTTTTIPSSGKPPAGSARSVSPASAPVPAPDRAHPAPPARTSDQPAMAEEAQATATPASNLTMGSMGGASLSMAELTAASGLTEAYVVQLQDFGLLRATVFGGTEFFDEEAMTVATVAAKFAAFGLEARHLRLYKNAADREVGLIEQVVLPMVRQRNPDARARANQTADELAKLGQQLKGSLLRSGLRDLLNG